MKIWLNPHENQQFSTNLLLIFLPSLNMFLYFNPKFTVFVANFRINMSFFIILTSISICMGVGENLLFYFKLIHIQHYFLKYILLQIHLIHLQHFANNLRIFPIHYSVLFHQIQIRKGLFQIH